MFLPENSSENEDFYNLGKDWQYETTVLNKFWLRIRYYQESINLWLDKEIDRAFEDQIAPRNRAVRIMGQSMFGTSNFGTKLWTSAPNVNFGTKFNWNVNFGTMEKDYVCRS